MTQNPTPTPPASDIHAASQAKIQVPEKAPALWDFDAAEKRVRQIAIDKGIDFDAMLAKIAARVPDKLPAVDLAGAQDKTSMTWGELPECIRRMIESHEWDNKNISEQRDWAIQNLDVALGWLASRQQPPAATGQDGMVRIADLPDDGIPRKFRKKPAVIEAVRFTERSKDQCCNFVRCNTVAEFDSENRPMLRIQTLEGDMYATPGDWIIKGVKGEFYPCKPDIFEATYDIADSTRPTMEGGT